jgi:hypothetical protein
MRRRASLVVVLAVAGLVAALGSSPAVGDPDCTNRFTEPSTGHIDVSPGFPVVAGTAVGFQLLPDGNNDAMIWDSVVFHIDGPSGPVDVKTHDSRGGGEYKPPKQGNYTARATWTRYDCGDPGRQTTAAGSATAASFEVVAGQRPSARFWTTKRARRVWGHNRTVPGDAALHVMAACPRDEVASHDPLTVDLYWTTNGRRPTHSSRHVGSRAATGCYSSKTTRTKGYFSASLNADASGAGAFIDVYEPLRADVLVEIHSGGVLVASRRAAFRRSNTGEGVTVRPA